MNGIYFTIPSIITALVKRLVVVVSMLGNILRIILNISLDYSGFTRRISGPYPGTSLPSLSLGWISPKSDSKAMLSSSSMTIASTISSSSN